jgi:hypothetical protein
MALSERVLSFTQDELVPRAVDQTLTSSAAIARFLGNAKPWKGESLKRPIKYKSTGKGGSFSGMGNFDTAATDTTVRLSYDLRAYEQPIVVPGLDKLLNQGEAQVVDLVEFKVDEARIELEDALGTMIYGDGTGNGNADFLGLDAIVDDATSVATIGGLARATYPVLNATRTASGGTVSLAKMATLVSNTSAGSATRNRPTVMYCNETVWDFIEQLITPMLQANYQVLDYSYVTMNSKGPMKSSELKGAAGFTSIVYKGIPIVADEKSTAQTLWAINENYVEWYGKFDPDMKKVDLGSKTIDSVYDPTPSPNHGFNYSGMLTPTNSYGAVGHLYLFGNLVSWQPRRNGRLTGIAGI